MEDYVKKFATDLAQTGSLFFNINPDGKDERSKWGLMLKDGRPSPYFVNIGSFNTGSLAYKLGGYFVESALESGDLKDGDVLFGPSHKGSSLAAAAAMYAYREHGLNLTVLYDHKEDKNFIGFTPTGKNLSYAFGAVADHLFSKLRNSTKTIIASPSYESNILSVACAIQLYKTFGLDVGFAYDRFVAKTRGEGTGKSLRWVGMTPESGSEVLILSNPDLTDPSRVEEFENSLVGLESRIIDKVNLIIPSNDLPDNPRIHLLDDVGTSMQTKYDSIELLEQNGLNLASVFLGVDRQQVGPVYDENKDGTNEKRVILGKKGEDAITNFTKKTGIPVNVVGNINDIVDALFKEGIPVKINGTFQPIDERTMQAFREYRDTYGAMR